MASIEEAIVTLLGADSTVAALAPGGVWPDAIPPATTFPSVRVTSVADLVVMGSDGPSTTRRVRVMVDAFAETSPERYMLGEAILAALCPFPSVRRVVSGIVVDGVVPDIGRAGFEPGLNRYRHTRDFVVWGGSQS